MDTAWWDAKRCAGAQKETPEKKVKQETIKQEDTKTETVKQETEGRGAIKSEADVSCGEGSEQPVTSITHAQDGADLAAEDVNKLQAEESNIKPEEGNKLKKEYGSNSPGARSEHMTVNICLIILLYLFTQTCFPNTAVRCKMQPATWCLCCLLCYTLQLAGWGLEFHMSDIGEHICQAWPKRIVEMLLEIPPPDRLTVNLLLKATKDPLYPETEPDLMTHKGQASLCVQTNKSKLLLQTRKALKLEKIPNGQHHLHRASRGVWNPSQLRRGKSHLSSQKMQPEIVCGCVRCLKGYSLSL